MKIEALKESRLGLVLSGGGVRGMAHIGLLQVLTAHGIEPALISGTSVGAIVGALYARGWSPDVMIDFFRETPLFRYNFLSIHKPGILDTDRYIGIFGAYFPDDSFESLGKSLFVTATNLQKGKEEVFHTGDLIRPLLASAAMPPVFSPVEIGTFLYADGGILNNFPSEPLEGQCDFLIGSNASIVKEVGREAIRNSLQLANRTTALMVHAINRKKMARCDCLFEPHELENIGLLDKKNIEKAYRIGYECASRTLERELA